MVEGRDSLPGIPTTDRVKARWLKCNWAKALWDFKSVVGGRRDWEHQLGWDDEYLEFGALFLALNWRYRVVVGKLSDLYDRLDSTGHAPSDRLWFGEPRWVEYPERVWNLFIY